MTANHLCFELKTGAQTDHVAATLAVRLAPGDTALLRGPVGAGKTHFARSLIRRILITPEDIPSPTFTLVQTYETTQGPLWHCDLYRIGTPREIEELGLMEAFDTAICLVEWPEHLGALRPADALEITLSDGPDEESRHLDASWVAEKWSEKLSGWSPA
jgi:tRNA threonylcarbamoyladenosine biosynthesis protein TsaE